MLSLTIFGPNSPEILHFPREIPMVENRYYRHCHGCDHILPTGTVVSLQLKTRSTDIDNVGPAAKGIINKQTIFVYPQRSQCRQSESVTLPALQWITATFSSWSLNHLSTLWQNGSISSSLGGWWSSKGYDSTRPWNLLTSYDRSEHLKH